MRAESRKRTNKLLISTEQVLKRPPSDERATEQSQQGDPGAKVKKRLIRSPCEAYSCHKKKGIFGRVRTMQKPLHHARVRETREEHTDSRHVRGTKRRENGTLTPDKCEVKRKEKRAQRMTEKQGGETSKTKTFISCAPVGGGVHFGDRERKRNIHVHDCMCG